MIRFILLFQYSFAVTPAKGGVQEETTFQKHWIPAFAGMTNFGFW